MNEYEYIYTKLRKEFGKYCAFSDTDPKMLASVEGNPDAMSQYRYKNPCTLTFDNTPVMSEHSVNTDTVKTGNKGQVHIEGGWPKEVDYSEAQDTAKWRKRLDKDPQFGAAMKSLCGEVEHYIAQNSTIDMFEDYFSGEEVQHQMQTMSTSTVAVFRDQNEEGFGRTVSRISWHPEGGHKFIASYSVMQFQRLDDPIGTSSFIWDVENPNVPVGELLPPSPLICTQATKPVGKSSFEHSHHDPVYDFVWLQSKTHSECATTSTDGRVLWWDVRNLSEPTDEVILTDGNRENPKQLGGCCLEWQQEAGPTKYLVGTEQGACMALNKKPKKPVEIGTWFGIEEKGGHSKHAGPVYALHRNPQHVKYFMTVGDWSVKIWLEELKAPLMQTKPSPAFLTTGGWSPTRAGLFMAGRYDGYVDFWDYFYRMNEVCYSHRVSKVPISTTSFQSQGRLLAVGDADGTVSLLQLCDELVNPGPNEKNAIGVIFEREMRREKNLEAIKKAQAGKAQKGDGDSGETKGNDEGARQNIEHEAYLEREKAWLEEVGLPADDNGLTIKQNSEE